MFVFVGFFCIFWISENTEKLQIFDMVNTFAKQFYKSILQNIFINHFYKIILQKPFSYTLYYLSHTLPKTGGLNQRQKRIFYTIVAWLLHSYCLHKQSSTLFIPFVQPCQKMHTTKRNKIIHFLSFSTIKSFSQSGVLKTSTNTLQLQTWWMRSFYQLTQNPSPSHLPSYTLQPFPLSTSSSLSPSHQTIN